MTSSTASPDTHMVTLPASMVGENGEEIANEIAQLVAQIKARTGAGQVDIISHSIGGLSSRWYAKFVAGGQSDLTRVEQLGGEEAAMAGRQRFDARRAVAAPRVVQGPDLARAEPEAGRAGDGEALVGPERAEQQER